MTVPFLNASYTYADRFVKIFIEICCINCTNLNILGLFSVIQWNIHNSQIYNMDISIQNGTHLQYLHSVCFCPRVAKVIRQVGDVSHSPATPRFRQNLPHTRRYVLRQLPRVAVGSADSASCAAAFSFR
jgi:hypothetical protein